jgi:hypothetical protein
MEVTLGKRHAAGDAALRRVGFLRRPAFAFGSVAAVAAGYSLVAYELSVANALPMPEPWLRIADQSYFYWGIYFYAPVIIAGWLLASAFMYLLSWVLGRRCAFDRLLADVALATGLGTLGTLIPDLITSPMRMLGVIGERAWEASVASQGGWFYILWGSMIAYVALFLVGYTIAVRSAAHLGTVRAIVTGALGFVVYQGFLLIFIR